MRGRNFRSCPQPEKEIILSLVYKEVADAVIKINAAVDLETGIGTAFRSL